MHTHICEYIRTYKYIHIRIKCLSMYIDIHTPEERNRSEKK